MDYSATSEDNPVAPSHFNKVIDSDAKQGEAEKFLDDRSAMLKEQFQGAGAGAEDKGLEKLQPMTPLAASATVCNLLLATGPFAYPYSFVGLGPILSTVIMLITCVLAYISATYMVEAIAMANSQEDDRSRDSVFKEEAMKTP